MMQRLAAGVGRCGRTAPARRWRGCPRASSTLNGNLMPGMATREEIAQLKAADGQGRSTSCSCSTCCATTSAASTWSTGCCARNPTPQEFEELAETMKKNQSGEVVVMENLLKQLGAQPIN